MAITTKQIIANDQTEVATKVQELIDSVTITTYHEIKIVRFGANQFVIILVYE
jgi:hypothetical protein